MDTIDTLKALIAIVIGAILAVVAIIVIRQCTTPDTTYRIESDNKIYFSDSYKMENGFIILVDYYERRVLPIHHSEPIILQGNIEVTFNK